jgi:hypothetical protein
MASATSAISFAVRQEFVQRWIEQADRHRQAAHDLEQGNEIGALHRQELGKRSAARPVVVGKNHLAHSANALFVEERVLGTAEPRWPSVPNFIATRASFGVSALARTFSPRFKSAHPIRVDLLAHNAQPGGDGGAAPRACSPAMVSPPPSARLRAFPRPCARSAAKCECRSVRKWPSLGSRSASAQWPILLQKSLMASVNSDSVALMRFAAEASDDWAAQSRPRPAVLFVLY